MVSIDDGRNFPLEEPSTCLLSFDMIIKKYQNNARKKLGITVTIIFCQNVNHLNSVMTARLSVYAPIGSSSACLVMLFSILMIYAQHCIDVIGLDSNEILVAEACD